MRRHKARKNATALKRHGSAEAKAFDAVQEPEKIPEDLGIKIGSPFRAKLEDVKNTMLEDMKAAKMLIRLNENIIPHIETLIGKEKERFK